MGLEGHTRYALINFLISFSDVQLLSSDFTSLEGNQSVLYNQGNLSCTDLSDAELFNHNHTVSWTRDFNKVEQNSNTISLNASGFYCCQILSNDTIVLTACATVVFLGELKAA